MATITLLILIGSVDIPARVTHRHVHGVIDLVDLPPGGLQRGGEVVGQLPRSELHGREQSAEPHQQHAAWGLSRGLALRRRQELLVATTELGR